MSGPPSGVTILNVRHASRVAAISTAAGPERLLEAGLAGAMGAGGRDVEVREVTAPEDGPPGEVAASFAVCDRISGAVRQAAGRGRLAVVLSGSCHAGLGAVSGIPEASRGVVWLDAHGDFHTPETTESGLLDGTTLAAVTGRCWKRLCAGVDGFAPVPDENVLLVGVRSLDAGEAGPLEASEIGRVAVDEAEARLPAALAGLRERSGGVYVHVDLDVLDASVGRANAYATAGGLSREGLAAALARILEACPVRAVTFASYDPAADEDGGAARAAVEAAGVIGTRVSV